MLTKVGGACELPKAEVLVKCFAVAGRKVEWDGFRKIEDLAKRSNNLSTVLGSIARLIRASGQRDRSVILEEPSVKNYQDAGLLLQIVFGVYSVLDICGRKV